MAIETLTGGVAFLLGRVLFGGVLAFMGVNHFADREQMTGYAQAKGIPLAGLAVPASGVVLVGGGLALVLGVFPVLAAAALGVFIAVSSVTMHDFWTQEGEARQNEMVNFLKNVAIVGGTLTLVAVGGANWPYALNVGVF